MGHADEEYPGLPIKLNACSNGEFVPPPPTPVMREAARRSRRAADENARRIGMSRRRFLLSSMGAATTLAALAACSREAGSGSPATTAGGADGPAVGPGGTFAIPTEAQTEADAAVAALGGEEFIFDVQTHFLDASHDIPDLGLSQSFPQQSCGELDPRDCFSADKYLDLMFNKSDTNVVMLSALPFAGSPLKPEVMMKTIAAADRLCRDHRVLMQGEAHPSTGPIQGVLDNMATLKQQAPVAAWKVYTHLGGPGWYLDDHDPSAPQVGGPFLEQVRALGPKLVAVHKGFSSGTGPQFADPVDIGPAARAHPDIDFVVYHSGFEAGNAEGPYDENRNRGVDRLITSVTRAGIGPGQNIYAELGSTWRLVMSRPDQAAHVLGKLLRTFGENRVVWGTDSIWYGSPQDQIQAFRAFRITQEYQERYGYPELTPKIKAKILGINSALLYGIAPITGDCRLAREQIESVRQVSSDANRTFGPVTPAQVDQVMQHHLAELGPI